VASPQPWMVTLSAAEVHAARTNCGWSRAAPACSTGRRSLPSLRASPSQPRRAAWRSTFCGSTPKLAPEKVGDHIVYTEQPLEGAVQSGDIVVVRLTVNATANEQYLLIEDPIPAGFEFIEQEGLYELKNKPSWWDFHYARREFHDDRAALFSTTFERGQGEFYYLLKAVTPGTFQANPARVLPMYEPERQASTRPLPLPSRRAEANVVAPVYDRRP